MKYSGRKGTRPVRRDMSKFADSDANLELESTISQTLRGVRVSGNFGSGYNPYDTIPDAKVGTGHHRIEDLRRLSEWIRMKRELSRNDED